MADAPDDAESTDGETGASDRFPDPEAEAAERFGDPEADAQDRFGEPESGLPDEPRDYSDVDVDPETARAFWTALIATNVAVLLVTLGPMLAYFRGRTALGAAMVLAGCYAFYRTYAIYRAFRSDD